MKLRLLPPSKALHPAHRVQNVERSRLEIFKRELGRLLDALQHSAHESEEQRISKNMFIIIKPSPNNTPTGVKAASAPAVPTGFTAKSPRRFLKKNWPN
ncbi:MAG: hypothetical protein IPI11_11985 [Haliscomenobacter sp.]|nr:hypothetical protein [Haliscomenobacter sp.]